MASIMAPESDSKELDLRRQMAEIDEALAKAERVGAEINQRKVGTKYESWKFALGGILLGAALFAAAAAFTKQFL